LGDVKEGSNQITRSVRDIFKDGGDSSHSTLNPTYEAFGEKKGKKSQKKERRGGAIEGKKPDKIARQAR